MQPRGACGGGGPRTAPAVALSRLAAAVVVAVAMAVVAGGGTPAFAWSPTAPHDAAVAATAAAAAGAVPWGGVGLPPLHPLDRQSSPKPTATPLPPRSEVPKNATWALEVVFATPAAFDAEATALNDLSADGTWPTLLAFRGTLAAAGPAGVVALYDELFALQRRVEVLWVYAQMQLHTDLADDAKKAAAGRAGAIRSSFEQAISWVGPELLALPPDAAATLVASPALSAANLTATVQSILRAAPHTLSAEGELVLQLVDRSKAAVEGAFGALSNADMAFPPIRDVAGVVHPVTQGNYGGHMRSRDRVRREAAFKSFTGEYNAHINTLAELLGWHVQAAASQAQVRNYSSALERALKPATIPTSIYSSLLKTVRAALPRTMHKYTALRSRLLAAQQPSNAEPFVQHHWDLAAPLFADADPVVPYDTAREAVVASVAPLGAAYQETVRAGLYEGRWVDIFPNQNKRSGAYSWGTYDTPPFILMNYQPNSRGMLTLAHEIGHSVHSALADATQPYPSAAYSIFVAEVASTFNEALLFRALATNASSTAEKAAVLVDQVRAIAGTFFTQARFAEFELAIHQAAEAKTPLTPGFLATTYANITAAYLGPAVAADPEGALFWADIPHFYYDFYVYQYATSMAASTALVDRVLNGTMPVDEYLAVLRAGSSVDPVPLLRKAGVDMETAAPFEAICDQFERLVDELDALSASMPSPPPQQQGGA